LQITIFGGRVNVGSSNRAKREGANKRWEQWGKNRHVPELCVTSRSAKRLSKKLKLDRDVGATKTRRRKNRRKNSQKI